MLTTKQHRTQQEHRACREEILTIHLADSCRPTRYVLTTFNKDDDDGDDGAVGGGSGGDLLFCSCCSASKKCNNWPR